MRKLSGGPFTYKGYTIYTTINDDNSDARATVYESYPRRIVLRFQTTSLDLATQWVDAYRKGEHWAVEAELI